MSAKTKAPTRVADPYLDLVLNVYPLRPIRTPEEHQRAKRALRSLAGDRRKVAADFKQVLVSIIEAYEREATLPVDTASVSAAAVVRHLLAERDLSVNAFAKARGISQGTLSDMLNGKRAWSRSVIVNVADHFGLNRGLFLR